MTSPRPKIAHPEFIQVLSFREWLRSDRFPTGSEGFVVEDLDLVVRWYVSKVDEVGKFMFCEIKNNRAGLKPAQRNTFRLIDELLRRGDPSRERYIGFYLIQPSLPEWENLNCMFQVNGKVLNHDDLSLFFLGLLKIPPYWG